MGKRSSFERIPRDFYPTPMEAVRSLLPHLPKVCHYTEPCAGNGDLIDHLRTAGHVCVDAWDIEPGQADIIRADARERRSKRGDFYITNPPWERDTLHAIILNCARHKPTWLLFDADWMHTRQSAPFMPLLRQIVSVGRVKWIPDSPFTGKDNCCWYLFDATSDAPAQFIGRAA